MQTLVLTALAVAVVGISESWGAAVIRNINDPKVVELSNEITHHASNDEVLDFIMEVSSHWKATGEIKNIKQEHLETWEAPFNISRDFPYYLAGYDDENRPIWIGEMGKWDLRRLVETSNETFAALDKYVHQAVYRIYRSFVEANTEEFPVNSFNVILDFDGYSLNQVAHIPTLAYLLHLFGRFHTVLDRHLANAVFINVNFVAEQFVTAVRPILGGIAERLEVFGSAKNKWMPALFRRFPQSQLPEWYGGPKDFAPVKVYG